MRARIEQTNSCFCVIMRYRMVIWNNYKNMYVNNYLSYRMKNWQFYIIFHVYSTCVRYLYWPNFKIILIFQCIDYASIVTLLKSKFMHVITMILNSNIYLKDVIVILMIILEKRTKKCFETDSCKKREYFNNNRTWGLYIILLMCWN